MTTGNNSKDRNLHEGRQNAVLIWWSLNLSLGYRIYLLRQVSYSRVVANQPYPTASNLVDLFLSLLFEFGSNMGRVLLLVLFSVFFVEGVIEDSTVLTDGEPWARVDGETQRHLHPLLGLPFSQFPRFPCFLPSQSRWSARSV
jgi:hypothetical protein